MLDDLHVEAAADEQRRQVVPQIVEAEGLGQPGDLRPRRRGIARSIAQVEVCRPAPLVTTVLPPHRATAAESCTDSSCGMGTGVRDVSDLSGSPRRCTGRDDTAHEVDVPDPQPDDLGGPQADERAEQDRRAQVVRRPRRAAPTPARWWRRTGAAARPVVTCGASTGCGPGCRRARRRPSPATAGCAARRRSMSAQARGLEPRRPRLTEDGRTAESGIGPNAAMICATCTRACRTVDGRRSRNRPARSRTTRRRSSGRSSDRRTCRSTGAAVCSSSHRWPSTLREGPGDLRFPGRGPISRLPCAVWATVDARHVPTPLPPGPRRAASHPRADLSREAAKSVDKHQACGSLAPSGSDAGGTRVSPASSCISPVPNCG